MSFWTRLSFTTISDFLLAQNNLIMPTGNLGIPRSQMPQIADFKKFTKILEGFGIKTETGVRIRIGNLRFIQNEVNKTKVFKLMNQYRDTNRRTRGGIDIPGFPPVVTQDLFVLDGTHRQAAMFNINKHAYSDYTMIHADAKILIKFINNNKTKFGSSIKYKGLME